MLLQPELLDAYASAMVQAAKEEPDGLGFIAEDDALAGRFRLAESERINDQAQEKLLLIATVEELLRHEIALKEITDQGVDLVFPSQFTRERPDAPDIPGKEVTFAFEGPLHSIYATPGRTAVALHACSSGRPCGRTPPPTPRPSAACAGSTCGSSRRAAASWCCSTTSRPSRTVRSQFETYVAEHLRFRALCRNAHPPGNPGLPELRLRPARGPGPASARSGMTTIRCPVCDEIVISLLDETVAANRGGGGRDEPQRR